MMRQNYCTFEKKYQSRPEVVKNRPPMRVVVDAKRNEAFVGMKLRAAGERHSQQQRYTSYPNRSSFNTTIPTTCTMTDQVRAAHLLIKHTGSRNPVSRRTGEQVTLAPADAMKELEQYEQKIIAEGVDESFPKYATERSDCSSFKQKGDLGFFGPGQMQQPFEEASFALQKSQMSKIVSTDSGYHLIYRIA
jgi:parvulin-like peptidyl-prolyl isomerase